MRSRELVISHVQLHLIVPLGYQHWLDIGPGTGQGDPGGVDTGQVGAQAPPSVLVQQFGEVEHQVFVVK